MDILNLLFDHFFEVIVFLFLFGGSIGAALRWLVRKSFEHSERLQDMRNEELRLKIQYEQTKNEQRNTPHVATPSDPLPKDASWHDDVQPTYEMGYQQQSQHQA